MLPVDLTWDLPFERRPPLSDLSVQHVGQHIAMVIAETPEEATFAASLSSSYIEAPAFFSADAASQALLMPDGNKGQVRNGSYLPRNFVKLLEERLQDSRGDEIAPETDVRISARFTTERNAHYPIELSSTIASWITRARNSRHNPLDCRERRVLAAYLGLPEDSVRIQSPLVCGAFGSRLSFRYMSFLLQWRPARSGVQ